MLFPTVVSQGSPRCSRGTRSISRSREAHTKPRTNFCWRQSFASGIIWRMIAWHQLYKKAVKIADIKKSKSNDTKNPQSFFLREAEIPSYHYHHVSRRSSLRVQRAGYFIASRFFYQLNSSYFENNETCTARNTYSICSTSTSTGGGISNEAHVRAGSQ